MTWAEAVEVALRRHVHERTHDSATGLAVTLDATEALVPDAVRKIKEELTKTLLDVVELVVPLLRPNMHHLQHAPVVVSAIFRMACRCAQDSADSFRSAATLLAPFTVQYCSHPTFAVAQEAQACLHVMTGHCGYDLGPIFAHCCTENDCFHFARQVPYMTKYWRPHLVLPFHDSIVQVLGTCVRAVGYVGRWYGYHGLCALYACRLEHEAASAAPFATLGLTDANTVELISHFPFSSLAVALQPSSPLASVSSFATGHTSGLSDSTYASNANVSSSGSSPTPTNVPGPMLRVFLSQIKDQHAWSTNQAVLAADASLREQYQPLLEVARLRAAALSESAMNSNSLVVSWT